MNADRLGPNQTLALRLIAKQPMTTRQLSEALGMATTDRAKATMSSLRDRGLAYICGYQKTGEHTGGVIALWAAGNKPDASKPKPDRQLEKSSYKQRVIARIGKQKWNAIQNAQKGKSSVLVFDGVKIWERGQGILI